MMKIYTIVVNDEDSMIEEAMSFVSYEAAKKAFVECFNRKKKQLVDDCLVENEETILSKCDCDKNWFAISWDNEFCLEGRIIENSLNTID